MKYNHKKWFVLPMRCLLFIAAFSFCSIITQRNLTELTHWWSILASVINIVTIVVLWIICKHNNTTYCEMIHYEKKPRNIFKGFLFIVIMLLLGMGGMYFAGWLCYGEFPYLAPMMIAPIPPYRAILNFFIPAFFYALQHSFIPTLFDMKFITYRFLSFLPLTIWICFKYYKGSPISYIMTGHWILNIATTVQIVLTSFYPEAYTMLIS